MVWFLNMSSYRRVSIEEWPLIAEEYLNGTTVSNVGRKFKCSRTTIRKILIAQNITIRKNIAFLRIVDPTPEEIIKRASEQRAAEYQKITQNIKVNNLTTIEQTSKIIEQCWYLDLKPNKH